jgi:signal transduction histidine kinase
MKKTTIILLLILEISLLFLFQNIHTLFKEIEDVDIRNIQNPSKYNADIKRIGKLFGGLSVILGLLVVATGFYLALLYRKSRHKPEPENIPPLHNYLLELKGSETQLKDMVEKQKENVTAKEELNKTIINNINSAVIFLNRSGRIDIFSATAEQLFNQSYANAKNNLPQAILAGFPEISQFIEENSGKRHSEEINSNNKIFQVELIPIEEIGQLLLIKEITEEKKREEIHLRNNNFVMLGEMAAFLAHEVRNSLGVIYGYTRTIISESDKINKVNKEINFLTTMMETYLSFSKPIHVNPKEPIDIADILKRTSAEADIRLQLPDSCPDATIHSDPTLIHSILTNLFRNSREAGADNIEAALFADEGEPVYLQLTDNGKGISEDIQEKIWFPFFTTKEKGTGMGLALIRKIINSLNGEISLTKSTSKGTTFTITFF